MPRCEFIDDLIPLILDADDHWWPRHFARLATVSPAWQYYVNKRLYPYPDIHSFASARLLADTLMEQPSLASLVAGISLRPVAKDSSSRRPKPAELKAVRYLLSLEGLKRIALGGELAVQTERFLRLIADPDSLTDLHVDGSALADCLSTRPSLEWDESLTFSFPALQKLRLTHLELDIIPPSMPHPSSLSTLVLENVHIISGQLTHLLNGAASLDRLHFTTVDPVGSDEQLKVVLASCTVGCLHYETLKATHSNEFVFDLDANCAESLRCLHLDGHFVDLGVLNSVGRLCRNLVELVVSGRAVRVSSQEWARFIRSGALSSLRRLGLPSGTNIPPFGLWLSKEVEEIRDACASRQVPVVLL
ncbi:hypothetical protein NLJ89_g10080 [Agrocybe chaxingu]|uniref:F-box domain-containing protein n=1 Tax=Agrocybe chaxingu TaxID=84603 RepID=A0A9W8JR92_9AGAR|nr:hypothetical protein NLJ89_g10080 [Agrocybe chaxingu]